jgi:hypothetical protein
MLRSMVAPDDLHGATVPVADIWSRPMGFMLQVSVAARSAPSVHWQMLGRAGWRRPQTEPALTATGCTGTADTDAIKAAHANASVTNEEGDMTLICFFS